MWHNRTRLQIKEKLVYFCCRTLRTYFMMNQDSFPFLLDTIFAELKNAARSDNETDEITFENNLNSSCANIVLQLVSEQKYLIQLEKEILIRLALERTKSIALSPLPDGPFATIWQNVLGELKTKLHTFLCIVQMTPSTGIQRTETDDKIEFQAGTTVAYLAAQTRVAFESGLFKTKNKSEICRQVASLCCTQRQTEIRSHSFRKHFNDPPLDALDKVEQTLEKQTKITKSLKSETIRRTGLNP
jgi:hypothetical protein